MRMLHLCLSGPYPAGAADPVGKGAHYREPEKIIGVLNMNETSLENIKDIPAGEDKPLIHVAPSPHIASTSATTTRMMADVLIALFPIMCMSVYLFKWHAVRQIAVCLGCCMAAEALFAAMRGRRATLADCSAAVTGIILGLSLPASAPWYIGAIASFVAIGIGKVVFGGLGMNIFNPAMVGRAFVMISFANLMGASAYEQPGLGIDAMTGATPLTALKQAGSMVPLNDMFWGLTNGSVGETSALLCLIGGIYLCIRKTACWEIPAGIIISVLVLAGIADLAGPCSGYLVLHHFLGGALLFGAFFIATDPVTSPVTPKGRFVFGVGIGFLVMIIRLFSGYPEGVMFAVLLMNALAPLINRWTIPRTLGGY
jgi:electron transport complex protein RnfD